MASPRCEALRERPERFLRRLPGDQSNKASQGVFTGRISGGGVRASGSAMGHGGTLGPALTHRWWKPYAN